MNRFFGWAAALLILVSCDYTDPFEKYKGVDLISKLDFLTAWTADAGLVLAASADTPPAGETTAYTLSFNNLISNSGFETDLSGWTGSAAPVPLTFQRITGTEMSGSAYMQAKVSTEGGKQSIKTTFSAVAGNTYRFKFNFDEQSGGDLRISAGAAGSDDFTQVLTSAPGDRKTAIFDIPCTATNAAFEVRFGIVENDPAVNYLFDIFVDQAAVYLLSNNSITKELSISGSGVEFNDGTGSTFEEGIYQMTLYAKADTSSKITLRLGSSRKEFSLSSSYQKIKIEAQVIHEDNRIIMEIIPTADLDTERFPGSVYLTKPKLYFLPDQSIPIN